MSLEHQHAGQPAHPVDVCKPGWSGKGHRGAIAKGTRAVYKTKLRHNTMRTVRWSKFSVSRKRLNLSATPDAQGQGTFVVVQCLYRSGRALQTKLRCLKAFRLAEGSQVEKGSKNALSKVSSSAEHFHAASRLFASTGSCWHSSRPRLWLRRTSPSLRLWILRILSLRVRALWLLRAAMVRKRCVHRRRPMVSRLLRTRLLRSRVRLQQTWLWLLRSRLLQTRCLCI